MAVITKHTCDHCGKEVTDYYLEEGWISLRGPITRSWGIRERGTAKTDFIKEGDFCSILCLVQKLDEERIKHNGPTPAAGPSVWDRLNTESPNVVSEEDLDLDYPDPDLGIFVDEGGLGDQDGLG